jgi:hypothetical protein
MASRRFELISIPRVPRDREEAPQVSRLLDVHQRFKNCY